MRDALSALIGKAVRRLALLRGGGSALPGLVVEKLDPGFLSRVLGRLPYGIVVVSGTNGKTTTTKMIGELLESQGLRVFTNRTGSNFSRGVAAAVVQECSASGRMAADIAVLELDEAHAIHFIRRVKPRFTLLLNVLRDQLDRFGELDTAAGLLQQIAAATSEGLVVNAEDHRVARIGDEQQHRIEVRRFGLSESLRSLFPSDDDFHGASDSVDAEPVDVESVDVELRAVGDHEAEFRVGDETVRTSLKLEGLYNTFNAAAALCITRMVLSHPPAIGATPVRNGVPKTEPLMRALAEITPAFGRGEKLDLDGRPVELVLVKNPSGFRLALASFDPATAATMIAINDQYADGRDMSWLWDVDFGSLAAAGVASVSGSRAWEMVLRLEHDGVPVGHVEEDLSAALGAVRERVPARPLRIFCTYTAMLELRRALAELTDLEKVW